MPTFLFLLSIKFRVALAIRSLIFSNRSNLKKDFRVVLQLSHPSNCIDAACFANSKGENVMIPLDISLFLNTLLFKSAATPGMAKVIMKIFDTEGKIYYVPQFFSEELLFLAFAHFITTRN